ncbi:MAG: 16S rRNA (guanine(966)-N(2))-methyltransferase RsmD [Lysobacteraceae bacterium]|nr:MAG: 16S rRNA (guanine(966)-N(2))-methyltransferase RsmD [Xanthomonadaceae bacterium]
MTAKRGSRPATGAGSLRIIAGRLRGSRLAVPDAPGLRPTPDRVRETLFNWLAPWIEGARCLDLYAGTGALGIEALSRGARECVFVERDRTLQQQLRDNLARLRVEGASVVGADALGFLAGPPRGFDLVFVDPPFDADLWQEAARRLEQGWLAPSALIHVEAPADASLSLPPQWQLHRQARAGAVAHALYRRVGVDPLS